MDCILLHVEYGSSIIVISNTKEDADRLIKFIKGKLDHLNEDTDAHSCHLVTTSEFAQLMSSEVCTDIIDHRTSDQLEESVSTRVSSMVAPSVDNNVSMKFEGDVVESTEFDILLHLSQYSRIYIEIKNPSHPEAELTKSDVVTDPLDNARRLRRYTAENSSRIDVANQTSIVVVVKGMEERRYQDLKPIASNRGIHLLQYDETGAYTGTIADIAVQMAADQAFNWN